MLENLPLFSINTKIWKHCGFIKFKNYWKGCTLIGFAAIMNLTEVLYLWKNYGNVEIVILSSFMSAILFNSIVRIVSVVVNQSDFIGFMEEIVQWHREAERENDTGALRILAGAAWKADKMSKTSLIFGSFGALTTAIVPLLLKERELPYPAWIPGIDVRESPYYELVFGIQAIFVMPFILVTYIPFTNLFISWLMFGIASLQILQMKLDNLMTQSKTLNEIEAELAGCIQYHNRIIRFRDKLNSMLSLTNLLEFLMFSLMLCVLLFFILIVDSFMFKMNAAIYIGCIFYVVLLFYWHANEFSHDSLKIADAAYNTDWTSSSTKVKKSISLIIVRSQNALQISAGGMYPMTLETFQSLLSGSYSYFTILKGMHQ